MSAKKEDFDKWISGVFMRLNGDYRNLYFEDFIPEVLEEEHWVRLRRIHEIYIENPQPGEKGLTQSRHVVDHVARTVILSAHGTSLEELNYDAELADEVNLILRDRE